MYDLYGVVPVDTFQNLPRDRIRDPVFNSLHWFFKVHTSLYLNVVVLVSIPYCIFSLLMKVLHPQLSLSCLNVCSCKAGDCHFFIVLTFTVLMVARELQNVQSKENLGNNNRRGSYTNPVMHFKNDATEICCGKALINSH